jgi:hypothetical protein
VCRLDHHSNASEVVQNISKEIMIRSGLPDVC